MTAIFRNQLICEFDYERFNNLYDVFELRTDEKYFKNLSSLLDAHVLDENIKAVNYKTGAFLYFLLDHNKGNDSKVMNVISRDERKDHITFRHINASAINEGDLIQLLFNGLAVEFEDKSIPYSNISGHSYVTVEKTKTGITTVEICVDENNNLFLPVKTFTSKKYEHLIKYSNGKKWESYAQYKLTKYGSLIRSDRSEKSDNTYILRQLAGRKNEIPFLDIGSSKKDIKKDKRFTKCKMGILVSAIDDFNYAYGGIAKITGLLTLPIDKRIEAKSSSTAVKLETKTFEGNELVLVDKVNSSVSQRLAEQVISILHGFNINVRVDSKVIDETGALVIIHNAEWYQDNSLPDQHIVFADRPVQFITLEEFADSKQNLAISEAAIRACLFDLRVKSDLIKSKLSFIKNEWVELVNGWKFYIPGFFDEETNAGKSVISMSIRTNREFNCEILERNPLDQNSDRANKIISFFETLGWNKVKCAIENDSGHVCAVVDTNYYGLPNIFDIWEKLKQGETDLRNKEERAELLVAVTDINYFEENCHKYYCVGIAGSGMQAKIPRASHFLEIIDYPGENVKFTSILPILQNVTIRNGFMSALPFPIKYLREYAKMQGIII